MLIPALSVEMVLESQNRPVSLVIPHAKLVKDLPLLVPNVTQVIT